MRKLVKNKNRLIALDIDVIEKVNLLLLFENDAKGLNAHSTKDSQTFSRRLIIQFSSFSKSNKIEENPLRR